MKLAASNLGWEPEQELSVLDELARLSYGGIEIAPTKISLGYPYRGAGRRKVLDRGKDYRRLGFEIPSMQSIWFGRNEGLFTSSSDRATLRHLTFCAIELAKDLNCPHLVIGSPKNRVISQISDMKYALDFFSECAEYASQYKISIGVEPNPEAYGTNFLNTAEETFEFVQRVGQTNLMINFDLGAATLNGEGIEILKVAINSVSHIHISSPYLKKIQRIDLLLELADFLRTSSYTKWVSVEIARANLADTLESLQLVSRVFHRGNDDN